MITGMPGGTIGIVITVMAAETTAMAIGSRDFSRGHSNPRKAAQAAPSSPHCFGSPIASPASAPTRVNRFHST
ncbi:Protein of unknown function [Propionibacterium freudenreichii]|nr:Hypothetical protein RM25_0651 [Propionibacterium freudenreichii subsp. freudenreichii]CEH04063.1 Protein of unknown function [Propionibacterium freudenreichii]CEI33096.1 Protein of unknown function [Propionibacterium freudenreichii]